jgi:hypothetical protein
MVAKNGNKANVLDQAEEVAASANEGESSNASIRLDDIKTERLLVPIVGLSPLIVHRFSEKAKKQMLDAMQGRKAPRENKDPKAEYEAAFYRMTENAKDGYGFPVIAFKAATIGGARFYSGVKMTELRQALFFRGEVGVDGQQLAKIVGKPHMREDVVKIGMSGADLRYRPEFPEWKTVLDVTYVASLITRNSVLSLINAGGLGVGVGEWRVERKGDFGTYQIDMTQSIQSITAR